MRLKADLTLLLVSIIWGSAFVAQRVAGEMGSVYLFNGVRYLLAAVVVLPWAIRVRRTGSLPQRISPPQYKWMLIAGLFLFGGSALQQVGLLYTTAGNAGFITSLYVVLVPIALLLGWREKSHWMAILAVVLAGVGVFLLSTGGRLDVRKGDALELAGALSWTLHVIVVGKYASRFESISFSVGQLIVCGALNLGIGFLFEHWMPLNGSLILAIVYTAFFSLGLCYTLQIWAQRLTPPADAALILSLESVFSVLAGWLILDETLKAIQILGCILIFLAVLLSQFKEWHLPGTTPDASSTSCCGVRGTTPDASSTSCCGVRGTIDRDHLIEGR